MAQLGGSPYQNSPSFDYVGRSGCGVDALSTSVPFCYGANYPWTRSWNDHSGMIVVVKRGMMAGREGDLYPHLGGIKCGPSFSSLELIQGTELRAGMQLRVFFFIYKWPNIRIKGSRDL